MASEEHGVVIEMLLERQEIQNMVGNLQRWANTPEVLHLSMEHLATDFNATVSCITRFAGFHNQGQLLREAQMLDRHAGKHVTSGKYNNTGLRRILEGLEPWGAQVKKLREVAQRIYERQNYMFGCPIPV